MLATLRNLLRQQGSPSTQHGTNSRWGNAPQPVYDENGNMTDRGWICQNSGLWCRQGPDPGLTMPTLRYEMGRFLALQTATIALAP